MSKYLGEEIIDINTHTIFKNFTASDWAMYFVEKYGQIDGDHHKQWVLDMVARALNGCIPIIKLAKWDNGSKEYRISYYDEIAKKYLDNEKYLYWVSKMEFDEEENEYYGYDTGIAP